MAQHQAGYFKGYTSSRLPAELIWRQEFPTLHDAFLSERQIKGWTRVVKEALMRGEFDMIHEIVKRERKRHDKRKQRLG